MSPIDHSTEYLVAGAEPLMGVPPLLRLSHPGRHFSGGLAVAALFREIQERGLPFGEEFRPSGRVIGSFHAGKFQREVVTYLRMLRCRCTRQRCTRAFGQCSLRAACMPGPPSHTTTVGSGSRLNSSSQAAWDSRAHHCAATTFPSDLAVRMHHPVRRLKPSISTTSCTTPVTGMRGRSSQHHVMRRRKERPECVPS